MIHLIVAGVGDFASGMGDGRKVHHGVHAGKKRRPIERTCQIRQPHGFDLVGKTHCAAVAHRGTHRMAGPRERRAERTTDEPRRARHQYAHHGLPRARVPSSQATRAPPSASAARSTHVSGSIALTSASAASARLSTKTRTTTSLTEKPRSVAR